MLARRLKMLELTAAARILCQFNMLRRVQILTTRGSHVHIKAMGGKLKTDMIPSLNFLLFH